MPASPPSFFDRTRAIAEANVRIRVSETCAHEQFQRDYCTLKIPDRVAISPDPALGERRVQTAIAPVRLDREMYFEVYRAERVSVTSILFAGGDWRWRFCKADGLMVASSDGYASESMCRQAVEALQQNAGTAALHEWRKR